MEADPVRLRGRGLLGARPLLLQPGAVQLPPDARPVAQHQRGVRDWQPLRQPRHLAHALCRRALLHLPDAHDARRRPLPRAQGQNSHLLNSFAEMGETAQETVVCGGQRDLNSIFDEVND